MSGYFGDLNSRQDEALKKLREAVADIKDDLPENDDYFYLRWLRARKFKVEKAEQAIRNHVEFRHHFGVNSIARDWVPPEVLSQYTPAGFFGEDRDGHPIWHSNMGNLDIKGVCLSAKKEDIVKYIIYYLETNLHLLEKCSEKYGRRIETVTSIIDLENLSYKRHFYWPGIVVFRELITILEINYPERINRVFLVKAPKIFPVGYNLVKRFMDENTRQKIVVFGHNSNNWKEELQKYISPDQLPQAYGGTRCEPDPCCSDFITQGGDIPQKYYMTEAGRDEMERVVVGRRETYEVEFQIDQPGTVLRWEFVTVDHSISYGWFLKGSAKRKSSNIIHVVPIRRVNSHQTPEVGFNECTLLGTYVLKFDNSRCWTQSKEVFYSVKLILPEEKRGLLPQMHDTECECGLRGTSSSNETATLSEREIVTLGVPKPLEADSTSLYFTPSPGSGSMSPVENYREELDSTY